MRARCLLRSRVTRSQGKLPKESAVSLPDAVPQVMCITTPKPLMDVPNFVDTNLKVVDTNVIVPKIFDPIASKVIDPNVIASKVIDPNVIVSKNVFDPNLKVSSSPTIPTTPSRWGKVKGLLRRHHPRTPNDWAVAAVAVLYAVAPPPSCPSPCPCPPPPTSNPYAHLWAFPDLSLDVFFRPRPPVKTMVAGIQAGPSLCRPSARLRASVERLGGAGLVRMRLASLKPAAAIEKKDTSMDTPKDASEGVSPTVEPTKIIKTPAKELPGLEAPRNVNPPEPAISNDGKISSTLPRGIACLVEYLHTCVEVKFLFRQAPDSPTFEADCGVLLADPHTPLPTTTALEPHSAATMLKRWVRSVARVSPLETDCFCPPGEYVVDILKLIRNVSAQSAVNGMGSQSLAVCWAPSLFRWPTLKEEFEGLPAAIKQLEKIIAN